MKKWQKQPTKSVDKSSEIDHKPSTSSAKEFFADAYPNLKFPFGYHRLYTIKEEKYKEDETKREEKSGADVPRNEDNKLKKFFKK